MKKKVNDILWGVIITIVAGVVVFYRIYEPSPFQYQPAPPQKWGAGAFLGYGVVSLVLFAGYACVRYVFARQVRHRHRSFDGAFPIAVHHTMLGTINVDINSLDGAAYRVNFFTGDIVILGKSDRQSEIDYQRNLIAAEQARHTNDAAYSGYLQRAQGVPHRSRSSGGVRAAKQMRDAMVQPKREWKVVDDEPDRMMLPPAPAADFDDTSIYKLTTPEDIVFARNKDTGEPVSFNARRLGNAKVICPTQMGKTNLVRSLMLSAQTTHKIWIIDPKYSWGAWKGHAEIADGTDTGQILTMLDELCSINIRRARIREGMETEQNRAYTSVYDLPDSVSNMDPILLVMDELNYLSQTIKDDGFMTQYMSRAMRLFPTSATQAIHTVAINQMMTGDGAKYMQPLLRNSITISGHTHDQASDQSVGFRGAHRLEPYTFNYAGQTIQAPLVDTIERKLLSGPVESVSNSVDSSSQQLPLPPIEYQTGTDPEDYRHNVKMWMHHNAGRKLSGRPVPTMMDDMGRAGYPITRTQAYVHFNRRVEEIKHGKPWEEIKGYPGYERM